MEVINKSLSEQIVDVIRAKITNLELKPGQKIDIDQLAQECRTSRTPVREALNKLVEKKLVEVSPRRGYFVVNLLEDQVRKICDLRKALEMFALRTSIFVIPKEELEELFREVKEAQHIYLAKKDRALFDETDKKLHWLIIGHCNNEYLSETFGEIFDLVNIVRHLQHRIEDALREHLNLICAMMDRDLTLSLKLLEEHLDKVKEESRRAVREELGS